jgi:hypothetical protein
MPNLVEFGPEVRELFYAYRRTDRKRGSAGFFADGTKKGEVISELQQELRNEDVWELDVHLHVFITSVPDSGGQLQGTDFCSLGKGPRYPIFYLGWMGPRADLDAVEQKIFTLSRN